MLARNIVNNIARRWGLSYNILFIPYVFLYQKWYLFKIRIRSNCLCIQCMFRRWLWFRSTGCNSDVPVRQWHPSFLRLGAFESTNRDEPTGEIESYKWKRAVTKYYMQTYSGSLVDIKWIIRTLRQDLRSGFDKDVKPIKTYQASPFINVVLSEYIWRLVSSHPSIPLVLSRPRLNDGPVYWLKRHLRLFPYTLDMHLCKFMMIIMIQSPSSILLLAQPRGPLFVSLICSSDPGRIPVYPKYDLS